MKKILFILFIFSLNSYCAFEDIPVDAKILSMSNAYVGLAEGINTIFANPAGLSKLMSIELTGTYSNLYKGLSDGSNISFNCFSFGIPLKNFLIAGLNYQSLILTDVYSEQITRISIAKKISKYFSTGINLKFMNQKYVMNEYLINDVLFSEKNNLNISDIDAGILFDISDYVSFGLGIINFLKSEYGFDKNNSIKLQQIIKSGFSYHEPKFKFAIDLTDRNVNFGIEKKFLNTLNLRTGFIWDLKQNNYKNISMGFGFDFNNFSFDYGVMFPVNGIENTNGIHNLSFNIKFVKIRKGEKEVKQKQIKEIIISTATYVIKEKSPEISTSTFTSNIVKEKISSVIPSTISISTQVLPVISTQIFVSSVISSPTVNISSPVVLETSETVKEEIKHNIKTEEKFSQNVKSSDKKKIEKIQQLKNKPETKEKTVIKETIEKEGIKMHIVKEGDTLPYLADKYYKNPNMWYKIYETNKENIEKGILKPGQILIIP